MAEQTDRPFEFEISLADGQKIVAHVGADDFENLRDRNRGYIVPPDTDPRLGAANLMYSMLLHRVDQDSGETGVKDVDGRNWILPARSIIAFNYRDLAKGEPQLLGFERRERNAD